MIYPLILAGGSGTRLWPFSRKYAPKQFIKLKQLGNVSLFQQSIQRAVALAPVENLRIIAHRDYKFQCLGQAEEIGYLLDESQFLEEPLAKNTLPAIAFGMQSIGDGGVGMVLSSDHLIGNVETFVSVVQASQTQAQKSLVVFGIAPYEPHTGYGYIKPRETDVACSPVEVFKEKPDMPTAERYIAEGYLWNAGLFLFGKEVFFSELRQHNPEIAALFETEKDVHTLFDTLPDLSIDYGLLEKSKNIWVSPLNVYWSDLWSFDSIDEYMQKTGQTQENVISIDSTNNVALSEDETKRIALVGVQDLIVVDTRDALLIGKKGQSQKIKDVVAVLKKENSPLVNYGMTVYRPWGSYTVLDQGVGFQTKRLSVAPGKKLSLQMHYHRSEHWVVVSGTARVVNGDTEIILRKGESTFIPAGVRHRLENPGKVDLHIIESQVGDYLGEDDIVRFDDIYGRA